MFPHIPNPGAVRHPTRFPYARGPSASGKLDQRVMPREESRIAAG